MVGVEDRNRLARLRVAVAPTDHPVANVIGEQCQPLVESPFVEQACLVVKELLDLAKDAIVTHRSPSLPLRSKRHSRSPRPSAAPSDGKNVGGYFHSFGTRWP